MIYRKEIDGLRALAVVAVILFHAGFPVAAGGFVGVDVFFVISGYLITALIMHGLAAGNFSLPDFYERRARRILPALFLVMLVCLPFAWLWLLPQDMKSFSESLVAVSVFASNILFRQELGYFDIAGEFKPLLHTWSLAIEEQFYLLFPILLVLAARVGRRFVVLLLAVLLIASLTLAQLNAGAQPNTAFYLLSTRGWELLLGAFATLLAEPLGRAALPKACLHAGAGLGLVMIVVAVFGYDLHTPFPGVYALMPTVGAVFILLFANQETLVGRWLGSKCMVAIGLLSYSAYLWHQPVLAFARHKARVEPGYWLLLALVLLSFALAWLSWKFIEAPFRDRHRFSRGQIIRMAFVGTAFFIVAGSVGVNTEGYARRFDYISVHDGDVGDADFYHYLSDHYFKCTPTLVAGTAPDWYGFGMCRQSQDSPDIDIALIGDSHAEHLFIGLADILKQQNIVYYIKTSRTLPGNRVFDDILESVKQSKTIHVVILAMSWRMNVGWVARNTTDARELVKTIESLQSAGKSVYLLDDIPRYAFNPQRCKFVAVGYGTSSESICTMPKQDVLQSETIYLRVLNQVARAVPALHYHAIRDLLCDDSQCSMVKNNVLMYRDFEHLNISGSRYIGAELVKLFPEWDNQQ